MVISYQQTHMTTLLCPQQ